MSESFNYDILNRLTSAQVTNPGGVQPALSYAYDALGNITSKSDVGSYSYSGAGPHAVTSISGPAGGSYSYDANGNMVSRNGTVITWNSDNLPVSITQNSSNSSTFNYAPDKHRYYQSAMIASVSETTVYVGAFEAVTTGGVTKYRYHLSADSREVAEVDLSNSGSSVIEKISYILSDHLGSIDVVETTDVNGNVLSTTDMSFGAWGNRREPNTWLPPVSSTETQADHNADRYGFTHQEMLDNVGIIHMNGRIYDPNLGRFLSVDPVFEFPTNTQSLNPYSYVLNNPLSLTDPTGYAAKTECGKDGTSACEPSTTTGAGTHISGHHDPFASCSGHCTITVTGNGVQNRQSSNDAQNKPAQHTDIGSPANQSLGCTQLVCSGDKIELNNPYRNPHDLETSNRQILRTELNEAVNPLAFPKPDPAGSKTDSVGYGYHLNGLAKIRLYKRQLNKNGSLSAAGADFLTRNFEQTYVHSAIAREVHRRLPLFE